MKTRFCMETAELQVKNLFECLGIALDEKTPKRFLNMLIDFTKFHNTSNEEIAGLVNKTFEFDEKSNTENMVIVKNIESFSLCEHHIALMYDMKISVAYLPKGLILGLSKIVRIARMVCKRLTLQEKICTDIIEIMKLLTHSEDIAVRICAKHSCITARGVENTQCETVTTSFSGKFLISDNLNNSFLNSLK